MRTCSPFTGAGGPDFVHCSGSGTSQAVAEKSPFFPEFGNVECGLCFFFPPRYNKKIRTVSYLNFGSIASYSSRGLSTFF